jgi:hypothetical protein
MHVNTLRLPSAKLPTTPQAIPSKGPPRASLAPSSASDDTLASSLSVNAALFSCVSSKQ